jgi:hypothetical protein
MAVTYDRTAALGIAPAGGKGFIVRLIERLAEARMSEAKRHVNGYLQIYDDETLRTFGYSDAEIGEIRRADAAYPLMI